MIVADTSGLLSLLDEGESRHEDVRRAVETIRGPILTIDLVLAELAFLLHERLGARAEIDFLDQLLSGSLLREPLSGADLRRAREILSTYADQAFGLTDAAVMAVAERLRVPVLTLDRRHFGVFQDASGRELPLLP
jgi:predicted nucleic acid-binding protein